MTADLGDQRRQDLVKVPDNTVVGNIEDQCLGVFVDRDHALGVAHADYVLYGTGDPAVDIQIRCDRDPALPDQVGVGDPALVDRDTRRAHSTVQKIRQFLNELKSLGSCTVAARNDDIGSMLPLSADL